MKTEQLDLHEIACVLFPHIREQEELKKRLELLKTHNYKYDPVQHCYASKFGRIDSCLLLKSLEEIQFAIRCMKDAK